MSKVLVANLITLIAVVFVFVTYQFKDYKKLLLFNTISNTVYIIQYIILGALAGALMNSTMIIRNIISYICDKKNKKVSKLVIVLFWAIIVGIQIISWDGLISIIPCVAIGLTTTSIFVGNDRWIRYLDIFACAVFLYYNWHYQAYVCVVTTAIEMSSSILYLVRLKYGRIN